MRAVNATPPTSDSPAGARAHVASLQNRRGGDRVPLSPEQARHLTRSRRLPEGAAVTAFDDAGRSAAGHLRQGDGGAWSVELAEDPAAEADAASLTVYAAVPKGGRADWMVEKLGELGTSRFVPILCERGVVEPGGGKLDRFARLAREAAKQSRRPGVMQIGPLTPLADALAQIRNDAVPAAVLATETRGRSLLGRGRGGRIRRPRGRVDAGRAGRVRRRGRAGGDAGRHDPAGRDGRRLRRGDRLGANGGP